MEGLLQAIECEKDWDARKKLILDNVRNNHKQK